MSGDQDRVRFTFTGEASRQKLLQLQRRIGEIGLGVELTTEPVVSPSVVIEMVADFRNFSRPAVTEDSIVGFLEAEDLLEADWAASTQGEQLAHILESHLLSLHESRSALAMTSTPPADVAVAPCTCPLRAVWVIDPLTRQWQIRGVEPDSFLEFTALAPAEIDALLRDGGPHLYKFGPRRLDTLVRMGERLRADIGE